MSKIVDRTIDFFELFAREQRPLSLSEIARQLDIPVSSCHNVLTALKERGYIYQIAPREGFYLTSRLLDIATQAGRVDLTLQRAESRLRALRESCGETVALSRANGLAMTYVLVIPSMNSFRVHIEVGTPVRAYHATSAGKALLAGLSTEQQRGYLNSSPLEKVTSQTMTDPEKIITELALAETDGIYLNREETVEGVTTISGRFVANGVTYVVTIPGPTVRILPKFELVTNEIKAVCEELSAEH